jgi:ParB family transcriptional regulator, chromosome partitioning protein
MNQPALRKRPSGLGRGLSALLGEIEQETANAVQTHAADGSLIPAGVRMIDIANIRAMPNQPRRYFDDHSLQELAASIKVRGMLQPIVVRDMDQVYEIIAGERRWRAAQLLGLHQVPVIIKEYDDQTAYELAIVENIQRDQLNPWEEGEAYRRMVDDYGYTQESLAAVVGKSRSHVANLMRLHSLPVTVHNWLSAGQITMGHARALIPSADPVGLARQIMDKGLSVRQAEALVRRETAPRKAKTSGGDRPDHANADILMLQRQLSDLLGLRTEIKHQAKNGSVTLHYSSLEQLDMICQRLSGEPI